MTNSIISGTTDVDMGGMTAADYKASLTKSGYTCK